VFRIGSGTLSVSSSTLTRSAAPSVGGLGGNGGNGGGAGTGGADGTTDALCQLLCGDVFEGGVGGSGPSGGNGVAGDPGMLCTSYDGTSCTP
jgi:hypothetical protein